MAASYYLVDIEVTDPDGFWEYVKLVSPMLERWGARYLVRGGETEAIEGAWDTHRTVLIEFPSKEVALEFYESDEYAPLLDLRLRSTNSRLLRMEGCEPRGPTS